MKKHFLHLTRICLLTAAAFVLSISPLPSAAQEQTAKSGHKVREVTGPYTYKNLNVYFLHGTDEMDASKVITLAEALGQNLVVVEETGSVNNLAVENRAADKSVLFRAGDIVKGGRQDRVIGKDMLLEPRSGKVSLPVFCVEHGRWSQRGAEPSARFSSSEKSLASKELKIAAQDAADQDKVWENVASAQIRWGESLGKNVKAAASESSLQLSLEDSELKRRIDEYIKAIESEAGKRADILGYAFAIDGKINSADIYPANGIFKRLWPKLLDATAAEAVLTGGADKQWPAPGAAEVSEFVRRSEAEPKRQIEGTAVSDVYQESYNDLMISETRSKTGQWFRKNFLTK